ncbi:MAG: N-acetylglucosamine-6-phosphate deacetylase [Clostridia bacterium]|nr:N-acetylglucosamine-6-phosphate deacetylase [Clostridia bacterium]
MFLKNAVVYNDVFEPVKADILTDGERIKAVAPMAEPSDETVYDLTGLTVIPGFVDMHIHGCAGVDTGNATPEALGAMSAMLVTHGVTSFCPTSMTLSFEELQTIFDNVRNCMGKVSGAYIQGINMEGPYIAMSKKGAQNGDYVRNPDKEEFRKLFDGCGGIVKVVDIAPECDGGLEFIAEVQPYCPVSIAHTAAGYNEAKAAIEAGARHITHLYNAQTGLAHRDPGVVGAAFDMAKTYGVRCELICDGFHIHPAALRIAFSQVGEDGSVIVSDSCEAAGCPDGEYSLGGQPVFVRDGKALLESGVIAASTSNMHQELKNVIRYGVPVKQAIKSATINPAKAIRVDHETGSIAVGKLADLVVMDSDWNIKMVIVRGEIKVNNL